MKHLEIDLAIGEKVKLKDGRSATVRYTGKIHWETGIWVGVELDIKEGLGDLKDAAEQERQTFLRDYYQREGRAWIHYYPRSPPVHHMYSADFEGQSWSIETNHTFLNRCPQVCEAETAETCATEEVNPRAMDKKVCEDKPDNSTIEIEIELICDRPRAYIVKNLLSDFECDQVIATGFDIGFKRSTVADTADIDPTRTSETVWVERHRHPVVERITKRIADVVQIDENLLRMSRSAETLQLVKYELNQYYNYHHDYGTDRPNSRYITFLMYLNTPEEGGDTAFRSAECWGEKKPLSVPAVKGQAMFFYNLLPDGNADVSTLHSGTHVRKGEKYMTNLWIWDPYFA